MNENIPNKSQRMSIELINKLTPIFSEKIFSYLNIEPNKIDGLKKNSIVKSELSGHNNQICLIEYYDIKKKFVGEICLKYSIDRKKIKSLKIESGILDVLYLNNILCPKVIDTGFKDENDSTYIIMETVKGESVNNRVLNIDDAEKILDIIKSHEAVLLKNLQLLQIAGFTQDIYQEIDFEKKVLGFIKNFTPNFFIRDSYNFLNSRLNNTNVIKQRVIITDRSAENMFIDRNNKISMIDFSTVRIGTKFDNWIQFIDDPRAKFSCTKEELVRLFFKKNNLQESEKDFYYAASIYTNLLQGIFTYKKDSKLSMKYLKNVNYCFRKLINKKGVLIDISH